MVAVDSRPTGPAPGAARRGRPAAPWLVGSAAVLLLLGLPLVVTDQYTLHIIILVLYFAYLGMSWNIIGGYAGQLSLGHQALIGIGGYVSSILFIEVGLSPWVGMLLGALAATVVGCVVGYPCFRLRGAYFALATVALGEILRVWVENTQQIGPIRINSASGLLIPPRGDNLAMFQFIDKQPYYYIVLAMLGLAVAVTVWIATSRIGYFLGAIRSDEDAAEALGINPARYKLIAMGISSFLAALGGTFYAQFIRYVNPERLLSGELAIEIALICIVGGRATLFGPILGSILLTPIGEVIRAQFGGSLAGLHLVLYGLLLMVVILFLPQGLAGPLGSLLGRGSAGYREQAEPAGAESGSDPLVSGPDPAMTRSGGGDRDGAA